MLDTSQTRTAHRTSTPTASARRPGWDIFCKVIDNHGDLGVCWRLARDLAERGHTVRLWCDDPSALAWMAPRGARGVTVLPWRDPLAHEIPAEVVIEAFGCDPPAPFMARMAALQTMGERAPAWINLEYLSAEAYVERSHRVASPQWHGPGEGLTKWFFYPGFTPYTGGLLREPQLLSERSRFDRMAFRRRLGIEASTAPPAHGGRVVERVITLFCYDNPALPQLLDALAADPHDPATPLTHLLITPGYAARQVQTWLRDHDPGPALRLNFLPYFSQPEFDQLLWASDMNLVRGEDSLVRALWAGRPMLWQLYPQDDDAHHPKLLAFLRQHLGQDVAPNPGVNHATQALFWAWNGLQTLSRQDWQAHLRTLGDEGQASAQTRLEGLAAEPDLVSSLLAFTASLRG
ncbi:MAG: elongation factor P maturation arginine rhamnosyltransferase EarP [Leptothrix ochracea]|uniref:elongation factor P maturation arginine rhamnosyltransferase EarP n=1 Tax=Leptothrix ochracea TaxID=735331 RepID=UPI0034E279BA